MASYGQSASDESTFEEPISKESAPEGSVSEGHVSECHTPRAHDQERKKNMRFMENPADLVTFFVGVDHDKFLIHRDVLSDYFEALETFLKGGDKYILEDISVDAFKLFEEYLYAGKYTLGCHFKEGEGEVNDGHGCTELKAALVDLYILAGRLEIDDLQTTAITNLVDLKETCGILPLSVSDTIYRNTAQWSGLRLLLIDQYTWSKDSLYFLTGAAEDLPRELLVDIACNYRDALPYAVLEEKSGGLSASDYVKE